MTQLESVVTAPQFESLFARYHDAIRRYCRRRLDAQAADDAAADVFVVAWRRIDDVPEGEAALLWLYGVARNVVAKANRSARRRRRVAAKAMALGAETVEPTEAIVVRSEEEQALLAALRRLRPDDQEVLRLKAWEDLSHAEIASLLNISVNAVDARVSRAMKRLSRTVTSGGAA